MDAQPPAHPAPPTRVLLVTQDQQVTRQLASWLPAAGYEVYQTGDGEEARRWIRAQAPDYLIVDQQMPPLDGVALPRTLRDLRPPQWMYVLLLTGRQTDNGAAAAEATGADDFLARPVRQHELMARLRNGTRLLQLERQLFSLARYDVLTGLETRQTFLEILDREWDQARSEGQSLSCVMIDIDYFKRINDVHGHAAGDLCLQTLARVLQEHCRGRDIVCRLAGDEFVALLPQTDAPRAAAWAERLRNRIHAGSLQVGDPPTAWTASWGVAANDPQVSSPKQLCERADQALRGAKQAGRDRVVIFGHGIHPPPQEPPDHREANPFGSATAAEVMCPDVATLTTDAPLAEAIHRLVPGRHVAIAVIDARGEFRGAMTDHDLTRLVCVPQQWSRPVDKFMTAHCVTFEEHDPAVEVYEYLARGSVPRAFVLRNKRPVGIVSTATLIQWLDQQAQGSAGSSGGDGETAAGRRPQRLREEA